MSKPIAYKDVLAMPGSELYRLLSLNSTKRYAEDCYNECKAREKQALDRATKAELNYRLAHAEPIPEDYGGF